MADELELLRRADPVPADDPRFRDGPLHPHAERRLARLLDQEPAPRRSRLLPLPPGRTTRARLVWGLAATAVVLALALDAVLGGPSAPPAVAAPRPLTVHARTAPVPLADMAALADAAAAGGSPRLRKGTHVQSWSLGMSDDKPPVTLPQERVVVWRADATHTELVVATDPRRPGRPVLSDEGGEPREVADGHVISRTTFPPMWSDAPPEGTPPHTAGALRAYLTEVARPGTGPGTAPLSTAELLDATAELLDHWTLGARESAALVRLLAKAEGLRPVGEVTDRLGRPGHAYAYDARGLRHLLILEPRTGAVLGMEDTFTEDDPAYGVRAGDVMDYRAWMR
ncbi:CU044_5270 family protein [Streptomyces sp. Caat 7-52]|uniref:CU044_5270 family protein n=1 Tax=Streptomyces sp. Caat 7-52 TaxID=2949637 RepID=UPI0020362ADE|nr:CU044_5270 family protein [Streptomyces sp. Caat 7-52]